MAKNRDHAPTEPSLPITPMLDMTFQLFAFFVITYNPQMERKFDFALPPTGTASIDAQGHNSGLEVPLVSELTLEVKSVREGVHAGNISQILVKTRVGETPVSNLEELARHLARIRRDLPEQIEIRLAGDSKLKWSFLVDVMDVCKKAGYPDFGFAPPPDLPD
jgi:biopolymer transport protein ExbD